MWVLLWGSARPTVVLSGALVAAACVALSRLPALPLGARPRWRRLPGLLSRFAIDLTKSSWGVSKATVRRGAGVKASIVAVQMPAGLSDVAVTLACNRLSLVPGSLVVDIDRRHDVLYVYMIDTADRAAAESARHEATKVVQDVARALPPSAEEGRER